MPGLGPSATKMAPSRATTNSEAPTQRKQRKRETDRIAQREHRKRQKEHITTLENKIATLQAESCSEQVIRLIEENERMREQVGRWVFAGLDWPSD